MISCAVNAVPRLLLLCTARKAPPSALLTSADPFASSSSSAPAPAVSRPRFSLGAAQPVASLASQPVTAESITGVLTSLSKQQRLDLLLEMKKLILANPEAARQLLLDNPHLAHLMLQLQLIYGLATPQDIAAVTLTPPAPLPAPPLPQPGLPPPSMQPMPQPPAYAPMPQYPPQLAMPPPPPAVYPSTEELLSRLPPLAPEQREIVVELLKLTPEQVAGLPVEMQQLLKDILIKMGIGRG